MRTVIPQQDILHWINEARTNPGRFAGHIEEELNKFTNDREYPIAPGLIFRANEGKKAWIEAVNFLKAQSPLQPYELNEGLTLAANDHVRDLAASNIFGHTGSKGSTMRSRITFRCGEFYGSWGECIGTIFNQPGINHALKTVMGLVVDDGVANRGHRIAIFSRDYKCVGCTSLVVQDKVYTVIDFHSEHLQTTNTSLLEFNVPDSAYSIAAGITSYVMNLSGANSSSGSGNTVTSSKISSDATYHSTTELSATTGMTSSSNSNRMPTGSYTDAEGRIIHTYTENLPSGATRTVTTTEVIVDAPAPMPEVVTKTETVTYQKGEATYTGTGSGGSSLGTGAYTDGDFIGNPKNSSQTTKVVYSSGSSTGSGAYTSSEFDSKGYTGARVDKAVYGAGSSTGSGAYTSSEFEGKGYTGAKVDKAVYGSGSGNYTSSEYESKGYTGAKVDKAVYGSGAGGYTGGEFESGSKKTTWAKDDSWYKGSTKESSMVRVQNAESPVKVVSYQQGTVEMETSPMKKGYEVNYSGQTKPAEYSGFNMESTGTLNTGNTGYAISADSGAASASVGGAGYSVGNTGGSSVTSTGYTFSTGGAPMTSSTHSTSSTVNQGDYSVPSGVTGGNIAMGSSYNTSASKGGYTVTGSNQTGDYVSSNSTNSTGGVQIQHVNHTNSDLAALETKIGALTTNPAKNIVSENRSTTTSVVNGRTVKTIIREVTYGDGTFDTFTENIEA